MVAPALAALVKAVPGVLAVEGLASQAVKGRSDAHEADRDAETSSSPLKSFT